MEESEERRVGMQW